MPAVWASVEKAYPFGYGLWRASLSAGGRYAPLFLSVCYVFLVFPAEDKSARQEIVARVSARLREKDPKYIVMIKIEQIIFKHQ